MRAFSIYYFWLTKYYYMMLWVLIVCMVMNRYLVLVENDESQWSDKKGELYHYPNKYKRLILPGTRFIYYKGRMINSEYENERLSKNPHYFGKGVVGDITQDSGSSKNYFATIENFQEFERAIDFKQDGEYLESSANDRKNYFRDGVREITREVYDKILNLANFNEVNEPAIKYTALVDDKLRSEIEGEREKREQYYQVRSDLNRNNAIRFHGLRCEVCEMKFEEVYGELGKGFIHIHHKIPLSSIDASYKPDIIEDFAPLCPNCHAMVHRPKGEALSITELKKIYKMYNT